MARLGDRITTKIAALHESALAQSGRAGRRKPRQLSGVWLPRLWSGRVAASDLKQTFAARNCCRANRPLLVATGSDQLRIPTARDATSAMVASEMADSAIMSNLALTVSGNVSAGENAVALVKAKNK